ncbi:MAG: hypothetical protein K0U41_02035 [Gammaproteobacteria bacterium]|nr:hypothetical protein [Gammaproteobacteria bacterium]
MGGFNTLVKNFADATCEMHLTSPSGLPVYGVQKADGSVDVALGEWVDTGETAVVGIDKFGVEIRDAIMEAKAPTVDADATINPSNLALRSMSSPDAKRFRDERKCDINPIDMLTVIQGRKLYETVKDEEGVTKEVEKVLKEEDMRVFWASLIADFINLPYEDDKGQTTLSTYSEDNALDFVKLMPGIVFQMKEIVFDPKKFERSTNSG